MSPTVHGVSDTASNRRDQISNFAEILRNAPAKQSVFSAVYRGKKAFKTVAEIAVETDYTSKRVTEIAKHLARGEKLFEQDREKINGKNVTVYRKLDFVAANRGKILSLAKNKRQLDSYHTKSNPRTRTIGRVVVRVPFQVKCRSIGIDEIEQFKRVKSVRGVPDALRPNRLPERRVKAAFLKLLKEKRNPKDWGGEINDIFTTRLTLRGHARRAAFALKGPAKKGILVPGKMGTNGDQIQRLFDSPAEVFFVQYEGEIAQSVVSLMENLATAKSILRGEVFFGVIDKTDTYRLRLAYPKAFKG
jgi:hypothetical protein